MKRWRRAIISLAGCCALAVGVATAQPDRQAQGKAAAQPTAEQLIAKYIRAIGGRAAIEKVRTRVTIGTAEPGADMTISLTISEKAPDKFLQELDVPGVGAVNEGFDGKMGWELNPQQGVQEMTGIALSARRRNSQFYRWLRMRELFSELKVSGTEKIGDRDAYVLDATPHEGYAEKFYFDTKSGILLRRDYKLDGPDGMVEFQMFYDDYREVDGIKLPFALRRVGPDNVLILKFTEIKQNVELDDAKFSKPVAP